MVSEYEISQPNQCGNCEVYDFCHTLPRFYANQIQSGVSKGIRRYFAIKLSIKSYFDADLIHFSSKSVLLNQQTEITEYTFIQNSTENIALHYIRFPTSQLFNQSNYPDFETKGDPSFHWLRM